MSGRLTASEPPAQGLAPLELGTKDGEPLLTARLAELQDAPYVALQTFTAQGEVGLTAKSAELLSDWLRTFARPKPKLELWGPTGIERECNASRRTVYEWIKRDDFPRPVPVVGGQGQVWIAAEVKAWVRNVRRKRGRPRKRR